MPKNWAVCSFQKYCNPTPTLSFVIYCFHVGNSCCLPSTGNPVMTWFESVDQSAAVGMCVAAPISNELCNQWDNILNTIYALKHMFGVDTKQGRKYGLKVSDCSKMRCTKQNNSLFLSQCWSLNTFVIICAALG